MTKALSENPAHLDALCTLLEIGTQRGTLSPVYGGFHHKMWRLETQRGTYAIKQLSADTDFSKSDISRHYNVTESVAEAFSNRGIPAIFALKHNKNYLQLIENIGYLVYPWTDAVALDVDSISRKHVLEVGRVLASMHCANISSPELNAVSFDIHPEDILVLLVQRATECNIKNADVLKEQLPNFLDIVARQKAATQVLEKHVVVSHGDLDHKNVLWGDSGEAILIDWESARKLNPTYEALLEALDWSGITSNFDHRLFGQFIAAYKEGGGVLESQSLQASYDCILGDWLNWLMYNVGRAVDTGDAEQRAIGSTQVDLSLATILRLGHLLPWLIDR